MALMYGRRVGGHQGVELAKAEGDRTPIETGCEFTVVQPNILHEADVAVINSLSSSFSICMTTGREGPTESLDLAFAG